MRGRRRSRTTTRRRAVTGPLAREQHANPTSWSWRAWSSTRYSSSTARPERVATLLAGERSRTVPCSRAPVVRDVLQIRSPKTCSHAVGGRRARGTVMRSCGPAVACVSWRDRTPSHEGGAVHATPSSMPKALPPPPLSTSRLARRFAQQSVAGGFDPGSEAGLAVPAQTPQPLPSQSARYTRSFGGWNNDPSP